MMSDYTVEMINDGMQEFYVHFHGPKESMFSLFFFSISCCFLNLGNVWMMKIFCYGGCLIFDQILTLVVLDLDLCGMKIVLFLLLIALCFLHSLHIDFGSSNIIGFNFTKQFLSIPLLISLLLVFGVLCLSITLIFPWKIIGMGFFFLCWCPIIVY